MAWFGMVCGGSDDVLEPRHRGPQLPVLRAPRAREDGKGRDDQRAVHEQLAELRIKFNETVALKDNLVRGLTMDLAAANAELRRREAAYEKLVKKASSAQRLEQRMDVLYAELDTAKKHERVLLVDYEHLMAKYRLLREAEHSRERLGRSPPQSPLPVDQYSSGTVPGIAYRNKTLASPTRTRDNSLFSSGPAAK